jgi:hypothetical protein
MTLKIVIAIILMPLALVSFFFSMLFMGGGPGTPGNRSGGFLMFFVGLVLLILSLAMFFYGGMVIYNSIFGK